MIPWLTWLCRKHPARTGAGTSRARLRLEMLEDRCLPSAVWYVNAAASGADNGSSWANAYTNLQSALGAAQSGDQVWVAKGTYTPTAGTDRTATFALPNGVAVYGGFAGTETQLSQRDLALNTSILSGDIGVAGNSSDNSYHVVTATNVGTGAILDGFTITDGNADGAGAEQSYGGGLLLDQSSPTLSDLTFTNDSASQGGAIYNNGGFPTVTNALFTADTATYVPPGGAPGNYPAFGGGAFATNGGGPVLTNVTISGNWGGAVVIFNGTVSFSNSIIWDQNSGSALISLSSSPDAGIELAYSDVQASGVGSINADPQFINAATGNFQVQPSSPVINAGTNTRAPATDIDGQPRPNDSAVTFPPGVGTDMGAFQSVDVLALAPTGPAATNAATINFQVVFSQPVTGFGPTGVVLGGTADPTTVQVTGSGTTYNLAVSGMTQNGTVTVNIPASAGQNTAGEGNDAWTGGASAVIYDTTPPVTTATLSGTMGNHGWFTGAVQVTLAATDATSGVASTSYQLDGGPTIAYTGPFTVGLNANGTHTVSFFSVDNAGNVEATQTAAFKIDATPPVTTATLTGTLGSAGWCTSPVHVTLAATDAVSGIASTSYQIDGGPVHAYSAPFTVTGNGTHTVTFFSVNNAGDIEATKSRAFKIDTTPPTTTYQLWGTDGRLGRYSSDVRVVLIASDATSGVAATYYAVDGGRWLPYQDNFFVSGLGQHHVTYYSVDKAGNAEPQQTVWFQIYALPPVMYVDPLTPVNLASNLKLPLAGFTTAGATVTVTVTDGLGHSVTAATTGNADGEWSLPAVDVHNLADGTLTIQAVAANQAGRTTQSRTTTKSSRLVLAFVQEPANASVGHILFAVVQLRDGYGNAMNLPGQAVTVSLVPTGPSATGTLHGTLTVDTVGDQATFRNLSVSAAGTYRLRVTDGASTTLSDMFSISV